MSAASGATGSPDKAAKGRTARASARAAGGGSSGKRGSAGSRASRSDGPLPYLNRELSWLEYSARVLFEASDVRNPILERINFLTIFAGMLDEFFQIRVVRASPAAPRRRPGDVA